MARDTPTSHLGLLAYPSSFLGVCGASRARNMLTSCHGDLDLYPPRRNSIRTLTLPTFLLTPQTGASWIFFFFTICFVSKKIRTVALIHWLHHPYHRQSTTLHSRNDLPRLHPCRRRRRRLHHILHRQAVGGYLRKDTTFDGELMYESTPKPFPL